MPVDPMMLSFVEDELSRTPSLIDRTVAATLSQLQQKSTADFSSRDERLSRAEVFETLQRSSRLFSQAFVDSLRTIVMADGAVPAQPAAVNAAPNSEGFQLLDESRVETDIEISRAAQAIDLTADWELRELQTFTSALIRQAYVIADSNPLSPAAYAQALWDASCAVTPTAVQRGLLFHSATGCLAKQLKMAWASACTRLESQGVEPSIYRTVVHAPDSIVTPGAAWQRGSQGPVQLLGRLSAARSGSAARAGQHASVAATSAATGGPRFSPAFEEILQRLETLLRGHAEQAPQSARSVQLDPQPVAEFAQSLLAHTSDVIDRQTVELLSLLFDSIVCDEQLSGNVRAVMARLQVSALRVALTDPQMLNNDSHPVWRLMNRIAQASQLWPRDADPRAESLLAFSASLVADIAAAERPTAELYVRALARLEEHLAAQLQAQREAAQGVIDALALTDRREVLRRELSVQFCELFRSTRTAPRVLVFMTEEWPRVVTESILRFGVDSEQAAAYLQTADDLCVSLNLRVDPQNRLQLFSLLPSLLKRLRAGMALIALPEVEQQAVLDDLMTAHTGLLGFATRSRAPTADVLPATPHKITGGLGPAPEAAFQESLIDVTSMDTVPADMLAIKDTTHTMPAELTETIITAAPCQWFLRGHWQSVQLLWRSESARLLLFAGETAGCPRSITGDALRRLGSEGLIKSLPDTGLLQRAVDRVTRKLANPP